MEETKVIEHLKNGDEFIFKYVYDQHIRMVFAVCYKMTGNKEETKDLTQDVFIKVFSSINSFREDSKLSTWIYRIAVNVCINSQRRKKIVKFLSLDLWDEEKVIASGNISPAKSIENSELRNIIQEALNRLPVKQKTALILSRYEEKSYKEIAEIMEISLPAVESLIFRAKENLAKKLTSLKNY